ncbi:MAG: GNAT family N-acetyltransferase [Candidatus Micrarchaeota archaeon]
MNNVTIRKLQKSDYHQFSELIIEEHLNNEMLVKKELWEMIKRRQPRKQLIGEATKRMHLSPDKAVIFLAEENEALVGYIWGNIIKRSGRVLDKIGFIEDWYLKEGYRRKGIGTLLWKELTKWFKNKGCNGLELQAFTTNQTAISIYHRIGFIDKTLTLMKKL